MQGSLKVNAKNARSERMASLGALKLLTRAQRVSWSRDLVWFHIDELNGIFDTLQPVDGEEITAARIETARERVKLLTTAATWNEDAYRDQAWQFTRQAMDRPEDSFGPAVFLGSLPSVVRTPEFERWRRELPAAVLSTIALLI